MAGSSVNFKAVKSASHAVSHASREVEPTYLLPEGKSLGTICLLDDKGMVASVLEAKMALASRQALRQGDYSPVWEGVINLRRPEQGEDAKAYKLECSKVISEWCTSYQTMTGHTVLRADIHLDEGHIVNGEALLNAHAHVICDKTNDKGRVLKVNAPELRKIQDMTANVTRLERGKNSLQTGRKHIDHQAYKYLAERGRLETQQQVGKEKAKTTRIQTLFMEDTKIIGGLKSELAQLKAQYDQDRATLKASGEATQQAYQALKKAHEQALEALKISTQKVEKMEKQITQLTDENTRLAADKAKFAAMATQYQAEKAKGTPAHLIVPGTTPATMPPKATRQAQEALKQSEPPIPSPNPEKPLLQALGESLMAMVEWIKSLGAEQEPVTASSQHIGPVKHLDDLHAVQKTGRKYAIHKLADLDKVPELDDPKMVIKYKDGKGTVKGSGLGLGR